MTGEHLKRQFRETMAFFRDQATSRKLYKRAQSLYLLKSFKIEEISTEQVIENYDRIYDKYCREELRVLENDWHKNERKLFLWFLICYSEEKKTSISNIKTEQWEKLGQIFFSKNPLFLRFQGLNLIKNSRRHNWTKEDDDLLEKCVKETGDNEWNEISKKIFFSSDQAEFISPKQCRQRWLNHINSSTNKNEWSVEEETQLLKLVQEKGKRWSLIGRLLQTNRTQHMVKNRYNSMIHKIRKRKAENEDQLIQKALESIADKESTKKTEKEIPQDEQFSNTRAGCQKKQDLQLQVKVQNHNQMDQMEELPKHHEDADMISKTPAGQGMFNSTIVNLRQFQHGDLLKLISQNSGDFSKRIGSFIISSELNNMNEAELPSIPENSPCTSSRVISPYGQNFCGSWDRMNESHGIQFNMTTPGVSDRGVSPYYFSGTPNTPGISFKQKFEGSMLRFFKMPAGSINQEEEEESLPKNKSPE